MAGGQYAVMMNEQAETMAVGLSSQLHQFQVIG